MAVYYNEIDSYAADWLENLIAAGHIAPGVVDRRSIVDVSADDLRGFTQCHFFAGIGGWSHALRLAGWPDDRPVWTGSCPCQPFSAAGKGGGFDDARHLWPCWFGLIRECRPRVVFGEQVASPAGLEWLDLVQSNMEGTDYAFAAVDCCSAGVGAPHIRQRLGFVADADSRERDRLAGSEGRERDGQAARRKQSDGEPERGGESRWLADADGGDASAKGLQRSGQYGLGSQDAGVGDSDRPGPTNGFWRNADWLCCRDGKWRPVESGISPLVNGVSGRVELVRTDEQTGTTISHLYSRIGALRGYGNAINPHQFAEIIGAYLETA